MEQHTYIPELYNYVKQHQIHTCNYGKCGGPIPPGQKIFLDHLHQKHIIMIVIFVMYTDVSNLKINGLSLIIIYYHPETFMFWNAHINVQYVTSRGLGKYLTKYVAKTEPSHIFNISDGDHYHELEHIIAHAI